MNDLVRWLLPPLAFFLLPLILGRMLTAVLLRWAPRLGLIDQPSERKVHTRPTPRAGGLAIYASLVLSALLLAIGDWQFPLPETFLLLAVGAVIVLLGLLDDLRPLPWQPRLGVQALVAAGVAFGWPWEFSWPARLLIWFWIVGLINAFNMLDNMDALSGGVAWIAAGIFTLAVLVRQPSGPDWGPAAPFLMLMGALTAFLWFNQPPARIFMGDAGSTFLGLFLAVQSLDRSVVGAEAWPMWAVPVCVLAVPWYDLISVVLVRLAQGRSPFHADKQHLSHRLVELGLGPVWAVRLIHLMALASGVAGLLLYQVTDGTGAALVGIGLGCWWGVIAGIEYFSRRKA
ncbi:MAG TPA: MraY family glycosyltransferase [Gemmataceae bacterium]|nr:MraY family glycosyltransferase [Gemmataceae bacterium]